MIAARAIRTEGQQHHACGGGPHSHFVIVADNAQYILPEDAILLALGLDLHGHERDGESHPLPEMHLLEHCDERLVEVHGQQVALLPIHDDQVVLEPLGTLRVDALRPFLVQRLNVLLERLPCNIIVAEHLVSH